MKVNLFTNSELGKFGTLGVRAEHIARACSRQNSLGRILAINSKYSSIPHVHIRTAPFWFRDFALALNGLRKVVGINLDAYRIRREIFEKYHSNSHRPCDIFHTWDQWPKTIEQAKSAGAGIVISEVPMSILIAPEKGLIDYLFLASRFLIDRALEVGYDEAQCIYQPYGVDTSYFTPAPADQSTDDKRFLFCGTLNQRKGLVELLTAWKHLDLSDAKLILCGRSTPFFRRLIRKMAPRNVVLRGHLNRAQLREEYQKAYAYVFPSHLESSAKVTYEALACGIPVITTEEAGSVISHGRDGFIVPCRDSQVLQGPMEALYDDESLRNSMGQAARSTAEKYTWDAYGERAMQHYRTIVSNSTLLR